jgi:hypothetical protein
MAKKKDKLRALLAEFDRLQIPTEQPGFCDHPNFLERERAEPEFLERYGRFVRLRAYDRPYLQKSRKIIQVAANGLHAGLVEEKRLGGCIDTSMTLARILDLHGIWNFVVRGSLKITFPPEANRKPFWFWPLDVPDGSGKQYGHKWVYAPPFEVIDVTLSLQDYDDGIVQFLPETVFADNVEHANGVMEDFISPSYLAMAIAQGFDPAEGINGIWPYYNEEVAPNFPACGVRAGEVALKYIPTGVGGSDGPLEKITSFSVKGKPAYEFYVDNIKPQIDAIDQL